MALTRLTYREWPGDPRIWTLNECDFSAFNLIVGRNASGKSRLLSVVDVLCKILSSNVPVQFDSGEWSAEFCIAGVRYEFEICFNTKTVDREILRVNGEQRLTRNSDGSGTIYYAKQDTWIDFKVPINTVAIQQRRDELQHPYIVELAKWASGVQKISFSTSMGRENFLTPSNLPLAKALAGSEGPFSTPLPNYIDAWEKFHQKFDDSIITDMRTLGYEIDEVGVDDMRPFLPAQGASEPLWGFFVKEEGRDTKVPSIHMSLGMFRALSLIVYLNSAAAEHSRTAILVDDIGEGLDFERAGKIIEVVQRHCSENSMQALLTSNDRFVMNHVSLEHWSVLRRTGNVVAVSNVQNSQKEFEDFKVMGLSNFEFFTSSVSQ